MTFQEFFDWWNRIAPWIFWAYIVMIFVSVVVKNEKERAKMPNEIILRPGDVVTCENDHPVCDVVEYVSATGIIRSKYFENWRDGRGGHSGIFPVCPECGGSVFQERVKGGWLRVAVHTKDGWLPKRVKE
jgi:hypothetical protein